MRLVVGLLTCISLGGLAQALASDQAPQGTTPASQPASAGQAAPAGPSGPASQAAPATQSPAPASQPASTTPSSAPAAPSATASRAHPTATAQSPKTPELTQAEKDMLSRGYKLEMRGPDKHFCRNENSLGTRFTKKVCVTPEEIAAAEANGKDSARQSQRVGFDYQKGGISPNGR